MAKQNDNRLWPLLISASLLLNAYLLFHKNPDKLGQVLATAGDQTFRWKDVSAPGQEAFRQLDRSYYLLLRDEAARWAENYVLPKEAQAKGMTVEALLKAEIGEEAKNDRYQEQKKNYLEGLFERYNVRFRLPPPRSFGGTEQK